MKAKKYYGQNFLKNEEIIKNITDLVNPTENDLIIEIGPGRGALTKYLTPVPFRGKQNYPGNIKYVAQFISENLNISIEELEKITNSNVKKLFNISI